MASALSPIYTGVREGVVLPYSFIALWYQIVRIQASEGGWIQDLHLQVFLLLLRVEALRLHILAQMQGFAWN